MIVPWKSRSLNLCKFILQWTLLFFLNFTTIVWQDSDQSFKYGWIESLHRTSNGCKIWGRLFSKVRKRNSSLALVNREACNQTDEWLAQIWAEPRSPALSSLSLHLRLCLFFLFSSSSLVFLFSVWPRHQVVSRAAFLRYQLSWYPLQPFSLPFGSYLTGLTEPPLFGTQTLLLWIASIAVLKTLSGLMCSFVDLPTKEKPDVNELRKAWEPWRMFLSMVISQGLQRLT